MVLPIPKYQLLLILLIGLAQASFGQDFQENFLLNAWIDLKIDDAGSAIVKGKFKNYTDLEHLLSFQLKTERNGASGRANNTQRGSFVATPNEEMTLSTTEINIASEDNFSIVLKIFDQDKLVAIDSIKSNRKIKIAQKPKPKKETIVAETAATKPNEKTPQKPQIIETDIELSGLIIDDTRSKVARDFYEMFYKKWDSQSNANPSTILIRELPARGRNVRVGIEIDGTQVFQKNLQAREEILEILSDHAVHLVASHLQNNETLRRQLENDDQIGSGIF